MLKPALPYHCLRDVPKYATLAILYVALLASSGFSQGYAPDVAAQKMHVAEGLQATLFAHEPQVRQPIFLKCDDRGRLWTIQYLQYPNPAGLQRINVDRWSRTQYDRVPKPPPKGPRGQDRITILEDTDGDGRADRFKDFVSGLNLVTGVAFGHGGVFVLNVPYLLFYPDTDRDDIPDEDPQVLLTGFGMEDAQSLSNHLTWGPDGWLYGVNGSTTTCRIREVEFQQGVWRYHPLTKRFELFCEGGANCYGVTFDEHGELFYSTNGGPFVHGVQGGYFYKSFGKHGPLHNLYAYHFFGPLQTDNVPGGPPTGGTLYGGLSFPEQYRSKFLAGNFLGHTASWWHVEAQGTTFTARFGERFLDAHDTWFGPTDLCVGPDGAVYISDFHDQRTAHPDPDANWDRSNGRIFRIQAIHTKPQPTVDVTAIETQHVVDWLYQPNSWYADRARVELARRRDPTILSRLRNDCHNRTNEIYQLRALWALYVSGGLDEATVIDLLSHKNPHVRRWVVRFLGDDGLTSTASGRALIQLAAQETDSRVQLQLAVSSKRLPHPQGLAIVKNVLRTFPHDIVPEERIQWSLWWAIEKMSQLHPDDVLDQFAVAPAWSHRATREHCLNLVRRYASAGTPTGYRACGQLITSAPNETRRAVLTQLNQGLSERSAELPEIGQGTLFVEQARISRSTPDDSKSLPNTTIPSALKNLITPSEAQEKEDALFVELALRASLPNAHATAIRLLETPSQSSAKRLRIIQVLHEYPHEAALPTLRTIVLSRNEPATVRQAAMSLLGRNGSHTLTSEVLPVIDQLPDALQHQLFQILLSRPATALELVRAVDRGILSPSQIRLSALKQTATMKHDELASLVRKHWGRIGPGTAEEKLATMRRFNNDLRASEGNAVHGKPVFTQHCGTCHRLHGSGNNIGPDLTSANRRDRAAMLGHVVDPSNVIRREYVTYIAETISGQVFTGLLAAQDAASITLLDGKNRRVSLPRNQLHGLTESPQSLMPEGLLDPLTPQQRRDLFAYLASEPPVPISPDAKQ